MIQLYSAWRVCIVTSYT